MALKQITKLKVMLERSSYAERLLITGLLIFLLMTSFDGGVKVYAQQNGSSTPQDKETDNKADQNLKSIARVNPSTLAMEMSVPLINYPGRNGNSLPFSFSYSSKVWRMDNQDSYFYYTSVGTPQYVTRVRPLYAERSVAGWTSSIAFPIIEEKLVVFDAQGRLFNFGIDTTTLNNNFQSFLDLLDMRGSQALNNNTDCGYSCALGWCPSGDCSHPDSVCVEWRANSCNGSGNGGNGGPPPGGGGPPPPGELPARMHYIKRVHVRMGNGSTVEFRKSDAPFGYCTGGPSQNEGPNCEGIGEFNFGTFLSVDGSGMRLERTAQGSKLFLPDGSRYLFPATSIGGYDGAVLYQATDFIDSDGNHGSFGETIVNGQPFRQLTDTLGRDVIDPFPTNFNRQEQHEGTQEIVLQSLSNQTQTYKTKWLHLKPVACDDEIRTNCGLEEGALENENENVYFYSAITCLGSVEAPVDANNQYPNEVLFPTNGSGLRTCNPLTGNTSSTLVAARFNPVVLAEVELPNQKKYVFKYNQFGEITKITYPTGSYETFVYSHILPMESGGSSVYDQTNRGVVERRVYRKKPDGGYELEQRWQYSAGASNGYYKITTTAPKGDDPLGNGIRTERYIATSAGSDDSFGFRNPLAGMPVEERIYAENDYVNPRSRTLTEWISKGAIPSNDPLRPAYIGANRDARVRRTISVTIEGSQALATLNEVEYNEITTAGNNAQTDLEYFSHLNVKRTKAYHYAVIDLNTARSGSPETIKNYFNSNLLASVSEIDYLYNADYKSRGIPSLPVESRILNPANTTEVVAKTQTIYDNLVPNSSSGYGGYSIQTYSAVGTSLNCSSGSQPPKICWENPNPFGDNTITLAYRGKPTTSRIWNKDNYTWIEIHTVYDIFGNTVKTKDPIGNETTTEFSALNKYAYPTKTIKPAPDPNNIHGTNQTSTVETTYDFMTGLVLKVKDDFGQETLSEYNDPLLRPTRISGVGNFAIPVTETIYDDDNLTVKVRRQLDQTNWDESTTFMDSLGRAFRTQAKDSQGDVFVDTKYDALNKVKALSNPYRQGTSTADILWSKTDYDVLGRAVQNYAPAAYSVNGDSLGTTEYSISSVSGFVGIAVTVTDASFRKNRSFTNALGQLIRVDEPSSTNTLEPIPQGTPNPSPSPSPTPPVGGGQCYGNAAPGCLNNGANDYPMQSTYYFYNAQGKMVRVQQGEQNRYFLFDSLGRMARVRQPEQEINSSLNTTESVYGNTQWTAAFAYDNLGNVKRATDANGVNVINEYDKTSRIIKRCYTKSNVSPENLPTECSQLSNLQLSDDTPPVEYFYDGKGLDSQQTPNFAKGKLTKVTSSVSETRYTHFDSLGRLLQSQQITDGQTYTSSYQYNLSGALVQQTYPSGRTVKSDFESDGDLSRVYGKAHTNAIERTYANGFSYTVNGRVQRLRLGNGRWESAKFNNRFQITELALGTSDGDGSLWKLAYEYGEVETNGSVNINKNIGNIARQTLSFNGLAQPFIQTFKYDSVSRLIEARETSGAGQNAPQTWKELFAYDRFGNRNGHDKFIGASQITQTNLTHPSIDSNTNRFQANQGYLYDKNGNLTQDPTDSGRQFGFNGDNKQIAVKRANGSTIGSYLYDGEGKRIKKKVFDEIGNLTEETTFVYDGMKKLIAEYSTKPPPPNPTTSYTATDQLDSPRVITDSNGNVVSRRDFIPFGDELSPDSNYRTTNLKYNTGDNVRQRFTGYEKDAETQLDFAEARYYNNQHGRFTAVDPLLASGKSANPQTFNRYIYVMNNPLVLTDPTGLQAGSSTRQNVCADTPVLFDVPDDFVEEEVKSDFTLKGTWIIDWDNKRKNPTPIGTNPIIKLVPEFRSALLDNAKFAFNRGVQEASLYYDARQQIRDNEKALEKWNNMPASWLFGKNDKIFSVDNGVGQPILLYSEDEKGNQSYFTDDKTYERPFWDKINLPFDKVRDYNEYLQNTDACLTQRSVEIDTGKTVGGKFVPGFRDVITTVVTSSNQRFDNKVRYKEFSRAIFWQVVQSARTRGQEFKF